MAAIALTIIILLNYLAFYYAYGAFKGSVETKKKRFFSRQKSRRCEPGGGVLRPVLLQDYFGTGLRYYFVAGAEIVPQKGVCNRNKTSA